MLQQNISVNTPLIFDWSGLSEADWLKHCANRNDNIVENGFEAIGCCRVGDLRFDLYVNGIGKPCSWHPVLSFNLLVGGIDTGYSYSAKEAVYAGKYQEENEVPRTERYPYSYVAEGDFNDSCANMSYNEFKEKAEKAFQEFILETNYSRANLLDKARETLHSW